LKIDKCQPKEEIAEALEEDALDLREISKLFGIKKKKSLDHLIHIEKSARHRALLWNQPLVNNVVFLSKSGLA